MNEHNRIITVAGVLLTSACAFSTHPTTAAAITTGRTPTNWSDALSGPTTLEWEPVVSGRWRVPRSGMINLSRLEAKDLKDEDMDIVLPVQVLRHPERGTFIIDTGVSESLKSGGGGGVTFPLSSWTASIKGEESLEAILARQPVPLSGVLLTHLHLDHVLGLPDVPKGTPLYTGPKETSPTSLVNALQRGTYENLFAGHAPTTELDTSHGVSIGAVKRAIDFFGDGSLWVIASPGHTPGSLAFLAKTTRGPVLFTGDTSHTRWGWEHQVEPGSYTGDHATNRDSLGQLASITKELPSLMVMTGHEAEPAGAVQGK
jgi:glyoxylase-like metal-dependent hydrolase (beta-lactamase superfamily II)